MALSFPVTCKKLVATTLGKDFKNVVKILTASITEPEDGEITVKNSYTAINASDINWSAGRYDPTAKPPLDCGFEGIGHVVAVGNKVQHLAVGQAVAYMKFGAFSEYITLNARQVFPIHTERPEYLGLLVSGLTAALALEKVGSLKKEDKVLVTAAAGGTGQFAVQLAKLKGCHVIGTCSSDSKCSLLKSLGCDRPVNYKTENLQNVLKEEYPDGVDVVYESVGGDTFEAALANLAIHGRLIVIGYISGYETERGFEPPKILSTLPQRVLQKSSTVSGFFLNHFVKHIPEYYLKLCSLYDTGKLKVIIDTGTETGEGDFLGLNDVYRAVHYLYSGKNKGKIIVKLEAGQSASESNKL